MATFIRPELQALFWKWREALFGAVAVLTGLWWAAFSGGMLFYVGLLTLGLGATLVYLGTQKARFRGASGGPGSVDVDEGQVTYFGPLTGGAMPLRDIDTLALVRHGQSPHWRLSAGQAHLHIPVDADGAEDLFDAFASLPGLHTERMLRVLKDNAALDTVIWQRADTSPPMLNG